MAKLRAARLACLPGHRDLRHVRHQPDGVRVRRALEMQAAVTTHASDADIVIMGRRLPTTVQMAVAQTERSKRPTAR